MQRSWKGITICLLSVVLLAGCEDAGTKVTPDVKQSQEKVTAIQESTPKAENLEAEKTPKFVKEQIRSLKVTENGMTSYQLEYNPREDKDSYLYWDMSVPYKSIAVVNTEAMYGLYNQIASIDLSKEVKVKKGVDTGIKASNTSIAVNYTKDSSSQSATKTMMLLVGKKNEKGQYYCALKGYENRIIQVAEQLVQVILKKKPYDMVLKVPYLVNVTSVSEVKVGYGTESHSMKFNNGTYTMDDKNVDKKKYCDLYSNLMGLLTVGEMPRQGKNNNDRIPILTIEFIRNTNKVQNYTVKLFSYDETRDSIQVNGEEFFLVEKKDVQSLLNMIKSEF